jgi:16S rRNA processing protein RimM
MPGAGAGSMLTLGQMGTAHGIRGWVLVRSYADPPDSLLDHEEWYLAAPNGAERKVRLLEGAPYKEGLRVRLEGIEDRDAARALSGWQVRIPRAWLPPLEEGEHYRDDLVGFTARNVEGIELGQVDYFADLPAGAAMVIRHAAGTEHWVPVAPRHLLKVDATARQVLVDWPAVLE